MTSTMRAMALRGGGFERVEIARPTPGAGEVRVRVAASAINPADEKIAKGELVGRFLHATREPVVLGFDIAGTVDAIGDGVTDLVEGDAVWGHLAYAGSNDQGGFSEYVTMAREAIAARPEGVSHHVAAAAATVSMTSLQSLRDQGGLGEGGKALIIGAGGGVGSVAVGVAKRLGAHVTGVCSTKDVERVEALGADQVIDRKSADPFAAGAYDVVFDTPAVHSFGRCAGVLASGGTYVTTLPSLGFAAGMLGALFSSKKNRFINVKSRRADLELVGGWLLDGLEVAIDSRHPVAEVAAALERQAERGRIGKVGVDVDDGWG